MTTRRRAALLLALALLGPGLAACGDSDDGTDDAVASLTGDDGTDTDEASDDGDGDGGGGQPDSGISAEQEDAVLEFAQCMRDNGVDMPDPEISDEGVRIRAGGPGDVGGPGDEEWDAANEECQPIMDEAMPELEIDPEEQAEMQDRLVEVAQCMRDRGYDMADPEVDENGRVTMSMGAPQDGGDVPPTGPDDEQQQDMEECEDEAGMEGPGPVDGGSADDEGDT